MFSELLIAFFTPLGVVGLLSLVGIVAFLDAMMFPFFPELFAIIVFLSGPDGGILWAIAIIATIATTESLGVSALYYIVEHIRVPERIKRIASKYVNILFVSDEKVVIMDRVVPVVPFIGAFISLCNWNYRKAITYNIIGCVAKYSFLLAFAGVLEYYFTSGIAGDVTLILVITIVACSVFINYVWDKRRKIYQLQ
ncbi:MAG: hypothetical protein FE041_03505 [Thermoplasmata archaeon]|nr:MAG: hypothetical protein FE041_03505 [Thermoplasmata archaeon]